MMVVVVVVVVVEVEVMMIGGDDVRRRKMLRIKKVKKRSREQCQLLTCQCFIFRSCIGGVAYVAVFNSSATWAATFRLRGYKRMLVIFALPSSREL